MLLPVPRACAKRSYHVTPRRPLVQRKFVSLTYMHSLQVENQCAANRLVSSLFKAENPWNTTAADDGVVRCDYSNIPEQGKMIRYHTQACPHLSRDRQEALLFTTAALLQRPAWHHHPDTKCIPQDQVGKIKRLLRASKSSGSLPNGVHCPTPVVGWKLGIV